MSSFSKILTAAFQIVGISAVPANADGRNADEDTVAPQLPAGLRTRVRYEIVGAGNASIGSKVGYWNLEWEINSQALVEELAGA